MRLVSYATQLHRTILWTIYFLLVVLAQRRLISLFPPRNCLIPLAERLNSVTSALCNTVKRMSS